MKTYQIPDNPGQADHSCSQNLQADWYCAGLLDAEGVDANELTERWKQAFAERTSGCQLYAVQNRWPLQIGA